MSSITYSAAPYIIRIAAAVAIAAVLFDFFRRRGARRIVSALKAAGALSPDTAISLESLGIAKKSKKYLRDGSMLRKVVIPEGDGFYLRETADDGSFRLPASLRSGAEKSTAKIVIGIIFTVIAAELLVYFFPQIASLFSKGADIFN